MSRRRPSRWLAPIAIVAVGAATYGIVDAGTSGGSGDGGTTSTAVKEHRARVKRVTKRSVYVVQSGDTLSSISLTTGIPVGTLQRLNPDIDVQALQPKQRLKLR
ncbi:MAG TPA: LysM domain-containing protein [Solirubrobacteraceae bacterium]|nr:LysM domain-containing protein [Solirubrobacteraceae bacterium]